MRRDARYTAFPSNFFDAIVLVSTIEHIGVGIDEDADLKTIKELNRVLKPKGIIITTPYLTVRSLQVTSSGRIYNRMRLKELTKNFQVLKEEYFYHQHVNSRIIWTKIDKKWLDKITSTRPCIACLVLQKP
jgi:ubiquinone/menaquinone biosynthesis C-methylase UbiE